jgi:hypothetical protein
MFHAFWSSTPLLKTALPAFFALFHKLIEFGKLFGRQNLFYRKNTAYPLINQLRL